MRATRRYPKSERSAARSRALARAHTCSAARRRVAEALYESLMEAMDQYVPIIRPNSMLKGSWDTLMLLMLAYTMSIVPLEVAFDYPSRLESSVASGVINMVIDVCFVLDVCLTLRTAYFNDGMMVRDSSSITRRYMRTSMPLDVLTRPCRFQWM